MNPQNRGHFPEHVKSGTRLRNLYNLLSLYRHFVTTRSDEDEEVIRQAGRVFVTQLECDEEPPRKVTAAEESLCPGKVAGNGVFSVSQLGLVGAKLSRGDRDLFLSTIYIRFFRILKSLQNGA